MSVLPIVVVSANHVAIIERMSQYSRTLKQGVHTLIPCVDVAHYVNWTYVNSMYPQNFAGWCIPLAEQCYDPCSLDVITNDGITVAVDLVVYFVISDPVKAVYGTLDLFRGIENLIETALAAAVRALNSDALQAAVINERMRNSDVKLVESLANWGVTLKLLRVQKVELPKTISDATTKLVASKRAAMVELEKLESEFDRKVKLAKHEELEKTSRYRMEELESEHRRKEAQKAQEAETIRAKSEADAIAYSTTKSAEARASAHAIEANVAMKMTQQEIAILQDTSPEVMQFLTLRHRFTAVSDLNKAATTTLIVGPDQLLEGASRAPFFAATNNI